MPRNLEGIRDRPELIRSGFPTKPYRRSWGGFGAWPFKPGIVAPALSLCPPQRPSDFALVYYSIRFANRKVTITPKALNLSNSQRGCFKKSLTFK